MICPQCGVEPDEVENPNSIQCIVCGFEGSAVEFVEYPEPDIEEES